MAHSVPADNPPASHGTSPQRREVGEGNIGRVHSEEPHSRNIEAIDLSWQASVLGQLRPERSLLG